MDLYREEENNAVEGIGLMNKWDILRGIVKKEIDMIDTYLETIFTAVICNWINSFKDIIIVQLKEA